MGGGGKSESKQEMIAYYPPGFKEFFESATRRILDYARQPHSQAYFQTLTPIEQQLQTNLTNLISRGMWTPIDRLIQEIYLPRISSLLSTPAPQIQLYPSPPTEPFDYGINLTLPQPLPFSSSLTTTTPSSAKPPRSLSPSRSIITTSSPSIFRK